MNRYGTDSQDEFEPGSRRRVLRNYFGITRVREAERLESHLLSDAYDRSVTEVDADLPITARMICEMHRDWLGTLYPMAGSYRTVDLSKNGFSFCHALYVPEQMKRFETEELRQCTPCKGALPEVAQKLALVHSELVLIHPFREGNGRLARWIAHLMAMQAGLPAPEYNLRGAHKASYFTAMRRAFLGSPELLEELFVGWLRRAGADESPTHRQK